MYTFGGVTFQFKETISFVDNQPSSLSVSSDHQYVVISCWNSASTYVYKYDGSNYVHHQTLTINSGAYVQNFLS